MSLRGSFITSLPLCLSAALLMSGCSTKFQSSPVAAEEVPIGQITGAVHGGQFPVSGAQIYLFAAGTSGYGSAAKSLITSGGTGVSCTGNNPGVPSGDCYVTTDNNGNFALSTSTGASDYSCTQGTQVYMVAVGGNPGQAVSGTTAPVTTTATFAQNSSTITVASTTGITNGMAVTGTAVGGTVTAVNTTTGVVTLSQQTTANGTNSSVTFSTTTATFVNNSTSITVAGTTGVAVGDAVFGGGVSAIVTAVSGTTVTLNLPTTSTGTNVPVAFWVPVNNTSIVQMAGLGQCPTTGGNLAAQVPYLTINEVTTVAFAYAMGGFATSPYNVGASATGASAIANAMANTSNIVNLQWGQAPVKANGNSNSINPQAKIYLLANYLATCVNTSSSSAPACTNLFAAAKDSSGNAATDESSVIFNIVHNQSSNVASITALPLSNPVFSPDTPLPAGQPTDWTMPVIYTGLVSLPVTSQTPPAYTSGPFNIAFDASGNAWIGDRVNGVVEIGPQGASPAPYNNNGTGNKFGMVKGVAVSPADGSLWVSDYSGNAVYVMNTAGSILATITNTSLGATDLSGPIMTAFSSPNGNAGSLAFEANETTTGILALSASTFASQDFENSFGTVKTPGWIAVDQSGAAWIPSTTTTQSGELTVQERGHSHNFTWTASVNSGAQEAYSMAVDSSGDIWLGEIGGTNQLYEIKNGSTSATAVSKSSSGWPGGVNGPYKLAIDGSNNIWIANSGANTVSAYSGSKGAWLSSSGFSTSAQSGTGCIVAAPDPSGNLWTANSDGSVTQLLGLATPTAAPLYGGASATSGGTTGNLGTTP